MKYTGNIDGHVVVVFLSYWWGRWRIDVDGENIDWGLSRWWGRSIDFEVGTHKFIARFKGFWAMEVFMDGKKVYSSEDMKKEKARRSGQRA